MLYSMHNLLAEVITSLPNLATVDDDGVDWEVNVHQTHPAFELVLGAIGQVTEVFADIASHRELLG